MWPCVEGVVVVVSCSYDVLQCEPCVVLVWACKGGLMSGNDV